MLLGLTSWVEWCRSHLRAILLTRYIAPRNFTKMAAILRDVTEGKNYRCRQALSKARLKSPSSSASSIRLLSTIPPIRISTHVDTYMYAFLLALITRSHTHSLCLRTCQKQVHVHDCTAHDLDRGDLFSPRFWHFDSFNFSIFRQKWGGHGRPGRYGSDTPVEDVKITGMHQACHKGLSPININTT